DGEWLSSSTKSTVRIRWLLAIVGIGMCIIEYVRASDRMSGNLPAIIAPIHPAHQRQVSSAHATYGINQGLHSHTLIRERLRTHAVTYPGGIICNSAWRCPT